MIQEPVDVLRAWGHVLVWDPRWAGAPGVSTHAKKHLLEEAGQSSVHLATLLQSLLGTKTSPRLYK